MPGTSIALGFLVEKGIFLDTLTLARVALRGLGAGVLSSPIAWPALHVLHINDFLVGAIQGLFEAEVDAHMNVPAVKLDGPILTALLVLVPEVEVKILWRGGAFVGISIWLWGTSSFCARLPTGEELFIHVMRAFGTLPLLSCPHPFETFEASLLNLPEALLFLLVL